MTSLRILVLAGFALLTIWPRGDDVAVWTEKRHRATAGMHQATVAAIPKLGAVIVTLPADLEVLDVRLQATGAVSARTIGLMK